MENLQKAIENTRQIIDNSLDSSNRFENIKEELFDYQLQYVQGLYEGKLKPLKLNEFNREGDGFQILLKDCTFFKDFLFDEYLKRSPNFKEISNEDMYHKQGEFARCVANQIYELFKII